MTGNPITNLVVAELLRDVAAALEIENKDKNKFRIIAYNRAADAIEHLSSEASDLWEEGKLDDIAGIGDSISKDLADLFKTGKSKHFDSIVNKYPPALFELMKVAGVGPKTAYKIATELGFTDRKTALKRLAEAIKNGKVAQIEGLGEATAQNIAEALKEVTQREKRMLLPYAREIADEVIDWLTQNDSVKDAQALGSLRRNVSTVGDIDIAVSSSEAQSVLKHFTKFPKTARVIEQGPTSASIVVGSGIQIDCMVQPPDGFGSLLQHFTGSKHHNIALRERALKLGLSLSEYGMRKTSDAKRKLITYSTEQLFYKALGMQWIPPEMREDQGEIQAAENNTLPKLVETGDILGDLQIHSDFDVETSHDVGESSMAEIVAKADDLGYEYVAFTEHNPSHSKHTQSQIAKLLENKKAKIEQLNASLVKMGVKKFKHAFNSLEIDILPDGRLPVSDEALDLLDFALVSIHSSFRMSKEDMTARVLSGLNHKKVKVFAHPTARLLNERDGIDLNWDAIFDFCAKNNKWIEVNCDPKRLDLPDVLVFEAIKRDIKLTLGTDAHHKDSMDTMRWGVSVLRRGWAQKANVVNTTPFDSFIKSL